VPLSSGVNQWPEGVSPPYEWEGAVIASDDKIIWFYHHGTVAGALLDITKADDTSTWDTEGRSTFIVPNMTNTDTSYASPALANGFLYCRTYDGVLSCMNFGAGSHGGPGVVQFDSAALNIGMLQGSVTVTVTRTNGISGAITVNYATSDGTAVAGTDYTATTGTLQFANDEGTKSFTVPILNNINVGPNKTVNLALSNPTGGVTLGAPTNSVLTIINDNGAYRMKIGPFSYNRLEPLTNFPALVVLRTNLNGFSYSQFASASGYDLRFSSSDNSQELNYEIEQWNTNGSSYVWVQVPQLQSGTFIWASWDNSAYGITSAPATYTTNGATWPTASYAGVWHMNQPNAQDSTANRNNGSSVAGNITNAVGLVDGAAGVANGYVHVNDSPTLDSISGGMTVSSWIRFSQLPNSEQDIIRKDLQFSMGVSDTDFTKMRSTLATSTPTGWTASNDDSFNPPLSVGPWYFIAFTYNGSAGQLWNVENGVPIGASPHTIGANITPNASFLGLAGIDSHSLLGAILDEVRVEAVSRSTNWMWASYLTVASNSSFSAYGSAIQGGGGGTNYTINAVAGANGSIAPLGYTLVALGGSQTFTITPNTYCNVTNVFVDGGSIGVTNSYTFNNVLTNHTISAYFSQSSVTNYTITAGAGPNGSIAPSGTVILRAGSNQTFAITGNSGYAVTNILVDGSSVGATNSYTFSNVQTNHAINAYFGSTTTNCTINASAGANGSITPSGVLPIQSGSSQTFTIAVNTGYNITNVLVDGSSVGATNSYTFTNVQTNHTISAWFGGSGPTDFSAWANSMTITFSGYNKPETLTNFPVLVVLNSGIPGFSYSQFASTNGYDLRFSADGSTPLNYEIEQWNPGGNSYVWVQVPQLSGSTSISAYWNNPGAAAGPAAYTINGAVWPTNAFAGVWHMGQGGAMDSTANANNGAAAGSISNVPGVAGTAQKVSGGGHVTIPNSSSLGFTAPAATYSGWVCFNTLPSGEQIIMRKEQCRELGFSDASHMRSMLNTGGTTGWTAGNDDAISAVTGRWYYVAFTYNGSVLRNFFNGLPLNAGHTVTGNITGDPYSTGIGAYNGNGDVGPVSLGLDAIVDEVRAERVVRSTNWIWATYLTMASNASFNVYGTVQGGGSTNAPAAGIPAAAWIQHYFPGTPTNNYASLAGSCVNSNGMTVWQDYLAGINPTNGQSFFSVIITNLAGQVIVVVPSVQTNSDYSGVNRYYEIDECTNLLQGGTWQPAPGYTGLPASGSAIACTNSASGIATFYRAKARLQ
jgi:hypothetical protein